MTTQKYFVSTTLILLGIYYLFLMLEWTSVSELSTWAVTIMIFGIAFISQANKGKQADLYLPGLLLLGMGLYYSFDWLFNIWPSEISAIITGTGIALLFHSFHKGGSYLVGVLTTFVGILITFQEKFVVVQSLFDKSVDFLNTFWPLIIIAAGVYILMRKK